MIRRLARGEIAAELMIAVGSEEHPSMIRDAGRLHERLSPYTGQGLELKHRLIDGEDHLSVVYPLISNMYKRMLKGDREQR